jgi:hypothetical protein
MATNLAIAFHYSNDMKERTLVSSNVTPAARITLPIFINALPNLGCDSNTSSITKDGTGRIFFITWDPTVSTSFSSNSLQVHHLDSNQVDITVETDLCHLGNGFLDNSIPPFVLATTNANSISQLQGILVLILTH